MFTWINHLFRFSCVFNCSGPTLPLQNACTLQSFCLILVPIHGSFGFCGGKQPLQLQPQLCSVFELVFANYVPVCARHGVVVAVRTSGTCQLSWSPWQIWGQVTTRGRGISLSTRIEDPNWCLSLRRRSTKPHQTIRLTRKGFLSQSRLELITIWVAY